MDEGSGLPETSLTPAVKRKVLSILDLPADTKPDQLIAALNKVIAENSIHDHLLVNAYEIRDFPPQGNVRKKNTNRPNDLLGFNLKDAGAAITNGAGDPSKELRQDKQKVGLKNLGATCYMNSMLQSLFMNTAFRNGLFTWDSDDVQTRPGSIIFQLQLLFASLQDGLRSCYDPRSFTDQLELETDVQQDVQEFYKYLITFLEEKLSQYPEDDIKNLIPSLFRGDLEYVTHCRSCGQKSSRPSQFYELEMHMEDAKRLEESISRFIAKELLAGDNAYHCERCQKAVEAERYITLKTLPEVLNFQLMRFQYDYKTGRKKKVKTMFSFPDKLDMTKFVSAPDNGPLSPRKNRKQEYELTSVLIHKGNSAYGGHYIALIRDETCAFVTLSHHPIFLTIQPLRRDDNWYQFDDDKVKCLGKDVFKSIAEVQREDVPAVDLVEDETVPGEDEYSEKPSRRGKARGRASRRKSLDVDVVVVEDEANEGEDSKQQDQDLIEESRRNGLMRSSQAYMLSYARKDRKKFKNPDTPAKLVEMLQQKNSELMDQITAFTSDTATLSSAKEKFQKAAEDLWTRIQLPEVPLDDLLKQPCNWIGTAWLDNWLKGNIYVGQVTNSATENCKFLCEHDRIDPLKATTMKRISPTAWEYLVKDASVGPPLTQDTYCPECVQKLLSDAHRILTADADKISAIQLASSKDYRGKLFWISKTFWKEFKKKAPKDLDASINSDIACDHHGLVLDAKRRMTIPAPTWHYIKRFFPAAIEFPCSEADDDSDACVICLQADEEQQKYQKGVEERKKREKSQFKELYKRLAATPTSKDRKPGPSHWTAPEDEESCVMMDFKWLEQWKMWVDDKEDVLAPPNAISARPLKCSEHNKLLFSANELIDNPKNRSIVLVPEKTWKDLVDIYGRAPGETDAIFVVVLDGRYETEHPCEDCIAHAQAASVEKARLFENASFAVRRASKPGRRTRAVKTARTGAKTFVHGLSHTSTVLDLKMRIYQAIDMEPAEQRVFLSNLELEEDEKTRDDFTKKTLLNEPSKTLSQYGVKAGDIFVVVEGEPELIEDDFTAIGASEARVGFNNTALGSGLPARPRPTSPQPPKNEPALDDSGFPVYNPADFEFDQKPAEAAPTGDDFGIVITAGSDDEDINSSRHGSKKRKRDPDHSDEPQVGEGRASPPAKVSKRTAADDDVILME